jgi:hypothetical protein
MYEDRPLKVPNEETRIEEIGLLFSNQLSRMMEAFAEVRASLKGQSLEPGMLRKISSLAAEFKR